MFLELIATFVAGFAGAGAMMALVRLTGNRLPRWLIPVAAGAAMLVAAIAGEYGWYPRTRNALPDGVVVAQTVESRAAFRPWTYVRPFVNRFMAVDTGSVRPAPNDPQHQVVDLYLFGRWQPTQMVQVQVDCDGNRRADPADGGGDDALTWRDVPADDAILTKVCEGRG